jgi:hypothetical protein
MRKYPVRFGERSRETRSSRGEKVRSAPTRLSPILANVYLHELDDFVEGLRAKHEKGKRKVRNLTYQRLSWQKSRMVKRGETKTREFQRISQQMRTLPTLQVDDPGFIRIKYLRYADDWIGATRGRLC